VLNYRDAGSERACGARANHNQLEREINLNLFSSNNHEQTYEQRVAISTCSPLSSSPHTHRFVLGTVVINNNVKTLSAPVGGHRNCLGSVKLLNATALTCDNLVWLPHV
jgi:hypothetical protein